MIVTNHEPTYLCSLYISILVMCSYLLIECLFSISTGSMLSFLSGFDETMFLEFAEELDNPAEGLSLVGDNSGESNNSIHFN